MAGTAPGTVLEDIGAIFGINAFASFQEIVDAHNTVETALSADVEEIVISSAEKLDEGHQTLFIEANGQTLRISGDGSINKEDNKRFFFKSTLVGEDQIDGFNPDTTKIPTVIIDCAINIPGTAGLFFGQGYDRGDADRVPGAVNGVINSTVTSNLYVSSFSNVEISEKGKVQPGQDQCHLRAWSTLTVNGGENGSEDIQFSFNYMDVKGGTLTLNNTKAEGGRLIFKVDSENYVDANGKDAGSNALNSEEAISKFILNNSTFTNTSGAKGIFFWDHSEATLTNGSVVTGNSIEIGETAEDTAAKVTVTGGSTMESKASLTNYGTLAVEDSTLVAQAIANSGTVTISGTSTINAELQGAGLFLVTGDNTTLSGTITNEDGESDLTLAGGNITLGANAKLELMGYQSKYSQFIVGNGALDGAKTVVTVQDGAQIHTQQVWVGGSASGSKGQQLIVTGESTVVDAFEQIGTNVRTDGYLHVTDKATYKSSDTFIAGIVDVDGGASFTMNGGNFYGAGADADAIVTISGGGTTFTKTGTGHKLNVGHASDANRKGQLIIKDDATAEITNLIVTAQGKVTVSNGGDFSADTGSNAGTIAIDNAYAYLEDFTNTGTITANDAYVASDNLDNTAGKFILSGACVLGLSVVAGSTLTAKNGTSLSGKISLYTDNASQTRDDSDLGLIVAEGDLTIESGLELGTDVKIVMGDTGTLTVVVDEEDLPGKGESLTILDNVELGANNEIVISVNNKDNEVTNDDTVVIGENGYEVTVNEKGQMVITFTEKVSGEDATFTDATLTNFSVTQATDGYYFVLDGTYTANSDTGAILTLVVTGPENFLGVPTYAVITGTSLEDLNAQLKADSFIADGANSLSLDELTFTLLLDGRFVDDKKLGDATVEIEDKTAPTLTGAVSVEVKQDTAFVTWNAGTDNVGITSYTVTIFDADGNVEATTDEFEVNADGTLQAVFAGLDEGSYTASVTAKDAAELSATITSSNFDVVETYSNPTKLYFYVGNIGGDTADDVVGVIKTPDTYDAENDEKVPHAHLLGIISANGQGKGDGFPLWDANTWEVVSTADIDGNGTDDLILRSTTGTTEEIAAYRLGTLEEGDSLVSLREFDTTEWSAAGTGDLDGDGRDELIYWQGATDATGSSRSERKVMVSSFHDNGGHNRDTVLEISVSGDWDVIAVGDVANPNKDCEHVVLHNATTGTVAYWDYNVFGTMTQFTLGTIDGSENWTCVDSGDFNGDGKDDLLWLDDDNNLVWSDSNDRCETYTLGSLKDAALNGYTLEGTGDFDNDGIAELLWSSDDYDKSTLAWSEVNSYNTLNQYLA